MELNIKTQTQTVASEITNLQIVTSQIISNKAIIIVPTYNRFKFFPSLIYQFVYQTYPTNLLSMIIFDDSTLNVEETKEYIDLLDDKIKSRITYIHIADRHLPIGEKRNLLNEYAIKQGAEYIICFDDDDYYPPEKVSYAIEQMKDTGYSICGSSILLIYYPHLKKIYKTKTKVNKIYPGHAYNGTLAYKTKYALVNKYNSEKTFGEEQSFLRNFKVGLLQLECHKVMLCLAHGSNTIDKNDKIQFFDETNLTLNDLISDIFLLNFFNSI